MIRRSRNALAREGWRATSGEGWSVFARPAAPRRGGPCHASPGVRVVAAVRVRPRVPRFASSSSDAGSFSRCVVAAPIVEYLAATGGAPGPAVALVRNPFAAIAAATVFCRYFIRDLRGRTRRWIVYLTPLTWLAALAIEGQAAPPVLLWLDMLFGLGVLGVVGFVVPRRVSTRSEERADYIGGLMDALLLPLGASMVSYGLWATSG